MIKTHNPVKKNYVSTESFSIKGRGTVYICKLESNISYKSLVKIVGNKVLIDQVEYQVKGVESDLIPNRQYKQGDLVGILV